MFDLGTQDAGPLAGPVHNWFTTTFPGGPTAAQRLAWPAITAGEHLLLVAPTGTGKTLAGFLAIIDRLIREHQAGALAPGLRCLYVSPLRSLGYDIERNLSEPLEAIRRALGLPASAVAVGVRTGDTSAKERRSLREAPPHLLITTPESLSLLLSQPAWHEHWRGVQHIIVDEVHALTPTKRGADLAVSLERLAARAEADPCRIGLSATCRPADPVAQYLVGPTRHCRVLEAPPDAAGPPLEIEVESLIRADEAPHRGLTYRRLLRRLGRDIVRNRTTIIFANTRALTEKLTHDLRRVPEDGSLRADESARAPIAAHHSALDAARRRVVESALKEGTLRAVVTSTSLELGVDIGSADRVMQVGLPGSVARCLQRVGRAGHRVGVASRGVLLVATAAELAGAVVTAEAARAGRIEPLRAIAGPLDVLCQQLIGMACGGEWSEDEAFALVSRTAPMARVSQADFDACLAFLAGELPAPAGAAEPDPDAAPRWTAPRIWRREGRFGIWSRRVIRWFWSNVGTINAEESVRVLVGGVAIGTVEAAYAERLQAGDRFVLDGRALEFRRLEQSLVHARTVAGEASLPRWSSDRQSLSAELAVDLARFRTEAAARLADGPSALRGWLCESRRLAPSAAGLLVRLFEAQEQCSEVPPPGTLLVEQSPSPDNLEGEGLTYSFHAPLSRSACEALARAFAARLGRRFGRDLSVHAADLGWSIGLPPGAVLDAAAVGLLASPEGLIDDVLEGLDRGELLARRFRQVAATALMVLRRPEGGRRRVGGLHWVSTRLYPLVQAACPDHPLLRETRREVLDDLLDTHSAQAWLATRPAIRLCVLDAPSPFTSAWIDPGESELVRFDEPGDALKRLHARLTAAAGEGR